MSYDTNKSPFLKMVLLICTIQVLAQIGLFAVPALLPTFMQVWFLSNTEAGWITGVFYLSYMVSVPILVSLTDRIDPKRIYLFGVGMIALAGFGYAWLAEGFWSGLFFRALWGIGWAGSYMPGLKVLSDLVEGPQQSRAVAAHAASIGVSSALSFFVAGTVADVFGWRVAMAVGGGGAIAAFLLMTTLFPSSSFSGQSRGLGKLLDFRPIFRNRSAVAYAIGYGVHTFEMSALRNWVVAFLTFVASYQGTKGAAELLSPAAVATLMGLVGVLASVSGNEMARRIGRQRWIILVMGAGMVVSAGIGFSAAISYHIAVGLVLIYGSLIWADSASLTAGAAGSAAAGQRGATLAVHSTLGYTGGFIGPLSIGIMLDIFGSDAPIGWGLAFLASLGILAIGPLAIIIFKPKSLAGDR